MSHNIYENGKIYCIRSPNTDLVYIGSTTQPLSKRFYNHKKDFKSNKRYKNSFEILKYGNTYIELIENYPCNSKEELNRREGEIMRNTPNRCNKTIAGRTMKEWIDDNKEKLRQLRKERYKNNKETVLERNHEYYKNNKNKVKECSKKYRENNREKVAEIQKKWYEKNKERCSQRKKEYREKNKEQIAKQRKEYYERNKDRLKEKMTCECGSIFTINSKARHFKTKKHQKWLQEQNNN